MQDRTLLVYIVIIVLLILIVEIKYQNALKKKKKKIRKKQEESVDGFELRESIDRFSLNVNRFNSLIREYPKEVEYFRMVSIEMQNMDALDFMNDNVKGFEQTVSNGNIAADRCNSNIDHQLYQSFMDSEEIFNDFVEQMQMLFSGLKDYVVKAKTVHASSDEEISSNGGSMKGRIAHSNIKSNYFAGCNSAESLEKRFKTLCKVYHPDNTNGDSEAFRTLTEEYKSIKKMVEDKK